MIKVDQDKCQGCGVCEAMCPDVFQLQNGKSKVLTQDWQGCDCDIKSVVDSCPEEAIFVD